MAIALALMERHQREGYARTLRRCRAESIARLEREAIGEMSRRTAKCMAPFALFRDDQVHHWPAAIETTRAALAGVPMELRAALAARARTDAEQVIARRVFEAVDTAFCLTPLPGKPGPSGPSTWEMIFQAEYGKSGEV
jgi:hypothetical protein